MADVGVASGWRPWSAGKAKPERRDAAVPSERAKKKAPAQEATGPNGFSTATIRTVGLVMTAIGLLVAIFFAYLIGFTRLQGDRAQRRLLSHFHPGAPALLGTPKTGQPVAILQIPDLGLNQVVVDGTSARLLEAGPGLLVGSAYPGTSGNTVIAGRRLTFTHPFEHLNHLRTGDQILVINAYGHMDYTVSGVKTVKPGQTDPASPSATAQLTLITSGSGWDPTDQLAVVANLQGKPVQTGTPTIQNADVIQASSLGQTGDATASAPALLWGLIFVGSMVGAVMGYRRDRHRRVLYLLSTPVVLALAILFFENLARLLPSTL